MSRRQILLKKLNDSNKKLDTARDTAHAALDARAALSAFAARDTARAYFDAAFAALNAL